MNTAEQKVILQGHYSMARKEKQMIELHTFHNDERIFVNTSRIQILSAYGNNGTQITLDNSSVKVKEDMETIIDLMGKETKKGDIIDG